MLKTGDYSSLAGSLATVVIAALGGPLPAVATAGLKEAVTYARGRYEKDATTRDLQRDVEGAILAWVKGSREFRDGDVGARGLAQAAWVVTRYGVSDQRSADLGYDADAAAWEVIVAAKQHDRFWGSEDHYAVAEAAIGVTYRVLYRRLKADHQVLVPAIQAVRGDIGVFAQQLSDRLQEHSEHIDVRFDTIEARIAGVDRLLISLSRRAAPLRPPFVGEIPAEAGAPPARETAGAEVAETQEHPLWSAAFAHAAVLLSAERFDDGAWGRALWRVGGRRFSDDVAEHGAVPVPQQRRAVSVTSWSALALRTALGDAAEGQAEAAYQFILRSYDEETGFFGSLHRLTSQTPMVPDQNVVVANPRHTASALKLLIERGRTHRGVLLKAARSSAALLKLEATRTGGWGESLRGRGNVLTTAYVADALLQAQEHRGLLLDYLNDREASFLEANLGASINNAFRWLSEQQLEDGQWGYRSPEEFPETRPYYTAHVICFLPQLFDLLPTSLRKLRPFLEGVTSLGGVPERVGGGPSLAPSAMVLFGLTRLGDESLSDPVVLKCIEACTGFVLRECDTTDARDLTGLEAIFTLAVSERLGNISAPTRTRVGALVAQLDQLRPYDSDPRDEALLTRIDGVLTGADEARLAPAFRARLADMP